MQPRGAGGDQPANLGARARRAARRRRRADARRGATVIASRSLVGEVERVLHRAHRVAEHEAGVPERVPEAPAASAAPRWRRPPAPCAGASRRCRTRARLRRTYDPSATSAQAGASEDHGDVRCSSWSSEMRPSRDRRPRHRRTWSLISSSRAAFNTGARVAEPRYSASEPDSPVRMRHASSTGTTQTLPSPIWPVRGGLEERLRPPGRRRRRRRGSRRAPSARSRPCTRRHGTPRCGRAGARSPGPLRIVSPSTPRSLTASFTSSSLNGLMIPTISFIYDSIMAHDAPSSNRQICQLGHLHGARTARARSTAALANPQASSCGPSSGSPRSPSVRGPSRTRRRGMLAPRTRRARPGHPAVHQHRGRAATRCERSGAASRLRGRIEREQLAQPGHDPGGGAPTG